MLAFASLLEQAEDGRTFAFALTALDDHDLIAQNSIIPMAGAADLLADTP